MKNLGILCSVLLMTIFVDASWAQRRSGADSQEGWIIRRTDKGIVKIPKRQKFRFEGSDISADIDRPAQSVMGTRVPRQNVSLVPVRTSFREEAMAVSGLSD